MPVISDDVVVIGILLGLSGYAYNTMPEVPSYHVIAAAALIGTLFINFNAQKGRGIFRSQTGSVSDGWFMDVTPVGSTFSIWGIIYTMQICWLSYGVYTCFTLNIQASPVIPLKVLILFSISCVANAIWLVLWDRKYLLPAALVIISLPILFWNMVEEAYSYGYSTTHVKIYRWIFINGLAMYATWTTIASFINMGMFLAYGIQLISQKIASSLITIALAFLTFWYTWNYDRLQGNRTFYTITPYFTVMWATWGVVIKQNRLGDGRNVVVYLMALCTMIASSILLGLKVYAVGLRETGTAYPTNFVYF